MSEIRVFNTHIEIYPYTLGEKPGLERQLSKYSKQKHRYIPLAFFIQSDILYLPRGVNLSFLQKIFNTMPTIVGTSDPFCKIQKGRMIYPPKNELQEESIEFLLSKGKFIKGSGMRQYGLNLEEGDGKTYCMINAILKLKLRTIIIVGKDAVREQWKKTILTMSNVEETRIITIEGSASIEKVMKESSGYDFYLVNHQTIKSYASSKGWLAIRDFFKKIKVGIKVIDESHQFFENILFIDFFSNVRYSYYLTATFSRGDTTEIAVYNRAFSSLTRFGENTLNYECKRKHIIMVVAFYHSNPSTMDRQKISTTYGFSSYNFIDYALHEEDQCLKRVVYRIMDKVYKLDGKILITSPKIESVNEVKKIIEDYTGIENIFTIHSKNTKEENRKAREDGKILSSTIKSVGTGDDIKGLRSIINLEPVGSKTLFHQLAGRLREFSKTDDTYLFYPVDTSFPDCMNFLKRITPVIKKKCKEIKIIKFDDI